MRTIIIGLSNELPLTAPETLEIADSLVRRVAAIKVPSPWIQGSQSGLYRFIFLVPSLRKQMSLLLVHSIYFLLEKLGFDPKNSIQVIAQIQRFVYHSSDTYIFTQELNFYINVFLFSSVPATLEILLPDLSSCRLPMPFTPGFLATPLPYSGYPKPQHRAGLIS